MSPSWHVCHFFMRHSFIPPFLTSRPSPEQRLCGHLLPCLFSGAPAERAACSWIPLIHTDTHDMNLDLSPQPELRSPHPNLSSSICCSAVPVQPPPGPTRPPPAGAPPPTQEQGRCCHRRANTLAAFGPPSKPRHSSRAEPQRDLNPFSFSFGKENKQGMWHSERGKINARLRCVFERDEI